MVTMISPKGKHQHNNNTIYHSILYLRCALTFKHALTFEMILIIILILSDLFVSLCATLTQSRFINTICIYSYT